VQFFVLPWLLARVRFAMFWTLIPAVLCMLAVGMVALSTPIGLVTFSFALLKTLEYTIRGVLNELVSVHVFV
jgi:hypothetical protein